MCNRIKKIRTHSFQALCSRTRLFSIISLMMRFASFVQKRDGGLASMPLCSRGEYLNRTKPSFGPDRFAKICGPWTKYVEAYQVQVVQFPVLGRKGEHFDRTGPILDRTC